MIDEFDEFEKTTRVGSTPVPSTEAFAPSETPTSASTKLQDGLEVLRRELSLTEIMRLIERTARWVDPATFHYLPIWYPEHARGALFYKADWSEPQMNKKRQTGESVHKREGNLHANKALTYALGLRSKERTNWSCCHLWGVDDSLYQRSNAVVQDRRFFSCVANMVLLPTPLKAFTDVMTDVKMMLRVCALHLYDWACDHDDVADISEMVAGWSNWDAYPASWPRRGQASVPLGVAPFSERVCKAADARKSQIRRDLVSAGEHYPREEVRRVLDYWQIDLKAEKAKLSRANRKPDDVLVASVSDAIETIVARFEEAGYHVFKGASKKVTGLESLAGQPVYLINRSSLNTVALVVHPEVNHDDVAAIAEGGVVKGAYFNSNMTRFPKRLNKGKKETAFGTQVTFTTLNEAVDFLGKFARLRAT